MMRTGPYHPGDAAGWGLRDHGLDIDMADLAYSGDRNDVARYLDAHGWETVGASVAELFVGLSPLEDDQNAAMFTALVHVTAT
jgi:hypothetical protein